MTSSCSPSGFRSVVASTLLGLRLPSVGYTPSYSPAPLSGPASRLLLRLAHPRAHALRLRGREAASDPQNSARQGGTGILPVITAGDRCVVEFRRLRRLPRSSRRRFLLWEGPLAANSELRTESHLGRLLPRRLDYPRIPTTAPVMEVARLTAVPCRCTVQLKRAW
jgi:hypothetical protein